MKKIIKSKFESIENKRRSVGITPGCACACACKESTASFRETRESIIKIYCGGERNCEVRYN